MNVDSLPERHYRSIWISDVHLGTRGCKAEYLLDFLRHTESEHLYLVGDIVDGWRLRRSWYWPQAHNDVVQKILRKARKGTNVVFVPGNHDEFARAYTEHNFGDITVVEQAVHVTADGWRFWCARRQFRRRGEIRQVAGPSGRRRLYPGAVAESLAERGAAAHGAALLVAVGLSEAQGQERRPVHRRLRADHRRGSPPPRRRRCRLRSYPSCRTARRRRHRLCQRRRLGESCTMVEHMDGRLEILDWLATVRARWRSPWFRHRTGKKETQCAYSVSDAWFLRSTASSARSTP